jgi:hypothetical protein
MIHQQLSHAVFFFLAEVGEKSTGLVLAGIAGFSVNLSRRVRTGRLRRRTDDESNDRAQPRPIVAAGPPVTETPNDALH